MNVEFKILMLIAQLIQWSKRLRLLLKTLLSGKQLWCSIHVSTSLLDRGIMIELRFIKWIRFYLGNEVNSVLSAAVLYVLSPKWASFSSHSFPFLVYPCYMRLIFLIVYP